MTSLGIVLGVIGAGGSFDIDICADTIFFVVVAAVASIAAGDLANAILDTRAATLGWANLRIGRAGRRSLLEISLRLIRN